MQANYVEISIKGRLIKVPAIEFAGNTIALSGSWLKTAQVRDEDWLESEAVTDPEACLERIRRAGLAADLFTFVQRLPRTEPHYRYHLEWDNVAAIPTADYKAWWEGLPQVVRKNVRRAERRGISVREVEFNDALVKEIVEINNETPVRQGRPFWHYGKSLAVVKRDYATLLDRSIFLGAYHEDKLVGFIKMISMGEITGILQIL